MTVAASKKDERPREGADSWKHKPVSEQSMIEYLLIKRNILIPSADEFKYPKPTGKVPVNLEWEQQKRLFPVAILPILARWLFMKTTGYSVNPIVLYLLTIVYNQLFVRRHYKYLISLSKKHGFLDGEVGRDALPENMTWKVFREFAQGALVRPLMVFVLAYNRYELPHLSLWLPVQLAIFTLIADFVYYWAHRATHEVTSLWRYHQRHHTTKHPVAYLLGFADEPQEVFDALVSPVLAFLMYPLGFDALYMWSLYFNSVEIMGHAGIRAYMPAILTSPLLRPFGLELVLEDHDLHHRFGWRDSYNYGKQSMFWDNIFGTMGERVETAEANVDYSLTV
ncbi:hypothetical protein MVES1_003771 [Malassezia vespertilionis]|uniref:Fatty acid hydroxylase domain-containing protein n=1 Tax=Malassezia vespertilionis TaxID=2020962 RepID=A0A2N1J8N6_9BASI|nr:uncharacterized protein MVES1_003771 [Malassezia vespertilionis]PKI82930.1 hypothetical protein MVES_003330 [Malassezia vespertilionis]WFD08399.1 hypothetical protein MVES1_003771 [Malassezia vespertilionis]